MLLRCLLTFVRVVCASLPNNSVDCQRWLTRLVGVDTASLSVEGRSSYVEHLFAGALHVSVASWKGSALAMVQDVFDRVLAVTGGVRAGGGVPSDWRSLPQKAIGKLLVARLSRVRNQALFVAESEAVPADDAHPDDKLAWIHGQEALGELARLLWESRSRAMAAAHAKRQAVTPTAAGSLVQRPTVEADDSTEGVLQRVGRRGGPSEDDSGVSLVVLEPTPATSPPSLDLDGPTMLNASIPFSASVASPAAPTAASVQVNEPVSPGLEVAGLAHNMRTRPARGGVARLPSVLETSDFVRWFVAGLREVAPTPATPPGPQGLLGKAAAMEQAVTQPWVNSLANVRPGDDASVAVQAMESQ